MPKAKPLDEFEKLVSQGFDPGQAREIMLSKARTLAGVAAPVQTTNGNSQERQDKRITGGADPELVRRHQEFLKTYVPPVLEKQFEVTLPTRMADYVQQWAAIESYKRKGERISPEKAIELIVRRYWQNDPDRQLMARGGTAPASLPPATWAQKSA